MKYRHVRLHGFGYELPPHVITSEAIEEKREFKHNGGVLEVAREKTSVLVHPVKESE